MSGKQSFDILQGENLSKTTIPKPVPEAHYYFKNWTNGSGKVVSSWSNEVINQKSTYTANFLKIPTYLVTFITDGHGTLDGKTKITVESGSKVASTPTAKPKSGYSFVGWYDGTKKVEPKTISISSNKTFKAVFNAQKVTVKKIPMYRLYNPNSGEHFYTANLTERDRVKKAGWRYEGVGWNAPDKGTPVFRLYNPIAGDHHYTLNTYERDNLKKHGWRYEGIGWYSGGNVKVYRQYNPNAKVGAHNFTTNVKERNDVVKHGWRDEGLAWYAE